MKHLVLLCVVVACGKSAPDPNAAICDHYAKMMVKCVDKADSSTPPAVLEDTAQNLCHKGMSGKYEEMFGAKYRAMLACVQATDDCAVYDKCLYGE